jgi:hypothetical protein
MGHTHTANGLSSSRDKSKIIRSKLQKLSQFKMPTQQPSPSPPHHPLSLYDERVAFNIVFRQAKSDLISPGAWFAPKKLTVYFFRKYIFSNPELSIPI